MYLWRIIIIWRCNRINPIVLLRCQRFSLFNTVVAMCFPFKNWSITFSNNLLRLFLVCPPKQFMKLYCRSTPSSASQNDAYETCCPPWNPSMELTTSVEHHFALATKQNLPGTAVQVCIQHFASILTLTSSCPGPKILYSANKSTILPYYWPGTTSPLRFIVLIFLIL